MWTYNYTYNNELSHHGILGMHWGVRRYQNKDGSLTPNGKQKLDNDKTEYEEESKNDHHLTDKQKKYIKIGASAAAVSLAVLGGMYLYKKNKALALSVKEVHFGKKLDISTLPDKDTILKSGTKLHRVSSKSIEDYSKEGKSIYVSYLNKDNRLYKEKMPKFIKQWGRNGTIDDNGKKAFEHILQTKNDIKIPSKKVIAEAYMKATNAKDLDAGRYTVFMEGLVDRKDPQVIKFFNHIKSKGYNAIIDENDAGTMTKAPLILLEPFKDIASSKSHKITSVGKFINVLLM